MSGTITVNNNQRKTVADILDSNNGFLPSGFNGVYDSSSKTLIVNGTNSTANVKSIIQHYFGFWNQTPQQTITVDGSNDDFPSLGTTIKYAGTDVLYNGQVKDSSDNVIGFKFIFNSNEQTHLFSNGAKFTYDVPKSEVYSSGSTPNLPKLKWTVLVGTNEIVKNNGKYYYDVIKKELTANRHDGIYRIVEQFSNISNATNTICLEIRVENLAGETAVDEKLRFLPSNMKTELHGYDLSGVNANFLINSHLSVTYTTTGNDNDRINLSPGYKSLLYLKDDASFTNVADCVDIVTGFADEDANTSFEDICSNLIEAEEYEATFLSKFDGVTVIAVTTQSDTSVEDIFYNGTDTISLFINEDSYTDLLYSTLSDASGFSTNTVSSSSYAPENYSSS